MKDNTYPISNVFLENKKVTTLIIVTFIIEKPIFPTDIMDNNYY